MIHVEGLTKTYGSTTAVDSLSFEVRAGAITGFVGPNGAGKSTTMQMMVGLTRPDSGNVTYAGTSYRDLGTPGRVVGTMLDPRIAHPGRSARNHLRTLAALHGVPKSRVNDCLEQVGLESVAKKRAKGFSLGMAQRLALASALIANPEVLMLDEPFNGLDPDGIRWLRGLLRNFADQGGTVLVSSHLISELSLFADDLVVIGSGRLLAAAPVADITSANEVSVLVESPAIVQLEQVLMSRNIATERVETGLSVSGLTRAEVSEIAMAHQIPLHGLTETSRSLEDTLIDMTSSSVEYVAR
jgi:ABC-2 type transport system ATP-binding protein